MTTCSGCSLPLISAITFALSMSGRVSGVRTNFIFIGPCGTRLAIRSVSMVAKHDAAQHSLMAQLKARRVKKTYLALVQGEVAAAVGRIEAPIGRDPKHRTRMAVVRTAAPSTTGLPRSRAISGLDAPRARPRDGADAPDPGPPRGDRPPGCGRPRLRHRDVAPRPGRRGRAPSPVPPRLAARADVARRRAR